MTAATKHKPPEKYRAPLRQRAAIERYLLARTPRRGFWFAFNVKAGAARLDFPTLLARHRASGYADEWALSQPDYMAAVRELHASTREATLWEWGTEDACRSVEDSDAFTHLWDGTDVHVKWGFAGRSGGWLVMAEYDGHNLRDRSPNEMAAWVRVFDYPDLMTLYKFVVQCEADFTPEAAASEVEYQAAFNFFCNACQDIPKPPRPEDDIGAGI
jgi:hypothetical protein